MRLLEAGVFPTPDPRAALRGGKHRWWQGDATWVSCGTEALYWAFRRLEAAGAEPMVWIPGYHCGLEVQAALDAGWKVGFLDVGPDLTIRADDVRAALNDGDATVLVIHYFGFVQPEIAAIRREVDQAGCVLLEDCTHALGSTVGVARGADVAVYSLHKSLPVVDGGLLEIDSISVGEKLGRAPADVASLGASADARRRWVKATIKSLVGPRLRAFWETWRSTGEEGGTWSNHETGAYGLEASQWTQRVAAGTDLAELRSVRRRHYADLLDTLQDGPNVVFSSVGEGDCPLGLPLRVEDRETLLTALRRKGIEAYVFGEFAHPTFPEERFPDIVELRDRIVVLPTHDRLSRRELQEVGARAAPLLSQHLATPLGGDRS